METLGRFLACGKRELEGVNGVFNSGCGRVFWDVAKFKAKIK